MSILVIEKATRLLRRVTLHEQVYHLLDWFACIETLAWEWIDRYYRNSRPDRIFLVQGQLLAPGYAISHRTNRELVCEIAIEAEIQIPQCMNTNGLLGYGIKQVQAAAGFDHQESTDNESPNWSICLETYDSYPSKRFKLEIFSIPNRTKAERTLE